MGMPWSIEGRNFANLSEIFVVGFSAVLILLQSVRGDSMGLLVHWSMDLHNDVMLMPDYGNESRFFVDLPAFSRHSYFTAGVIGGALSLSSQKVKFISNIRKNDCIRNPAECKDGISITFWLYIKKMTRKNYQVILRSTSFDASGPGVYVGGGDDVSMMRFLLRTAQGVEYSRKLPWSHLQMRWCHFTLIWNSSHGLEVFLNGSSLNGGQNVTQGQPSYPTRSDFTAGDVLGPIFLLDDLWIFYQSLPGDTTRKIYELGLPTLKQPLSNLKESNLSDSNRELLMRTGEEANTGMTTTALFHESSVWTQASSSTASRNSGDDSQGEKITLPHSVTSSPYQTSTGKITTLLSTSDATLLSTSTFRTTPKRSPLPSYSPSTVPYMGWFYNHTWFHVFVGMTFFVPFGISIWLCVVHCILPKPANQGISVERTEAIDMKPFINNDTA